MKENESLRAIFIEVFKRDNLGDREKFYASNAYNIYFKDLEKLLKGLYRTVNNVDNVVSKELSMIL